MSDLISAHVSLVDVTRSQTAAREGIDNSAPADVIARAGALAQAVIDQVWDHFGGIVISSFYRCGDLNTACGGAATSQHTKGEAVDMEVSGVGNPELAEWIKDNLVFDQCILEYYTAGKPFSGWVHCSYIDESASENVALGRKNRKELLTIGPNGTTGGLNP